MIGDAVHQFHDNDLFASAAAMSYFGLMTLFPALLLLLALSNKIAAGNQMISHVVQVYPGKWHDREAAASTRRFRTSIDINELLDADVIVTDCWPSDAEPAEMRAYQITPELLDKLHPDAEFVPCPPVSRRPPVSWLRQSAAALRAQ